MNSPAQHRPAILAPAGNRAAFLAALAAGADAVYCGLKSMSARMEAKNFSLEELAQLVALAHDRKVNVYVTVNALLKPDELDRVGQMIDVLARQVKPDALIVQDLGVVALARQVGFAGEIHLSTLANVGFPRALAFIVRTLSVACVVVPRELSIDEIKAMGKACPKTMELETFLHGALCYGVSGRCYWSSYMGGRSSLRGRCVQPCRRYYRQGDRTARSFSCQDYSVDVLVKILGQVKKVRSWKIEGRKKGPHYVYYTVSGYQLLRDRGQDNQAKRDALDLLAQSLGREATHYNFLPQRPQRPIDTRRQTASGLFLGKVQGPAKNPWVVVRQPLMPGDVLRVGYEDETGHAICRVTRNVPKKGRYPLNLGGRKTPRPGAPVFLTDRREKALEKKLADVEAAAPPQPVIASIDVSGDAAPAGWKAAPQHRDSRPTDTFAFVETRPRRGLAFGSHRGEHRQIGCRQPVDLAAAGDLAGRRGTGGRPAGAEPASGGASVRAQCPLAVGPVQSARGTEPVGRPLLQRGQCALPGDA